jgi:hypothetical protein
MNNEDSMVNDPAQIYEKAERQGHKQSKAGI